MAENELSKAELWIKRIQDFYSSGLSRKAWCQEHQISLSTFSYWLKNKQSLRKRNPNWNLFLRDCPRNGNSPATCQRAMPP